MSGPNRLPMTVPGPGLMPGNTPTPFGFPYWHPDEIRSILTPLVMKRRQRFAHAARLDWMTPFRTARV